jgi:chromate transporter
LTESGAQPPSGPHRVAFGEALRFWLKLGFINFGGPTGQIAIMHEELVERRRWISERRFLHALNYCMLLPGPEAQQLAVYVGWLLHRTAGGLIAGTLFVLPGAALMLALSWSYAAHGSVPWVAAIFHGLRAAVVAIVAVAVIRIASKALKNGVMYSIAAAAFVGIFLFKVPFPAIVVGAGLLGLLGGRAWPRFFEVTGAHGGGSGPVTNPSGGSGTGTNPLGGGAGRGTAPGTAPSGAAPAQGGGFVPGTVQSVLHDEEGPPEHARPTVGRLLRCVAIGLVVWLGPLLIVAWWRGRDDVLTTEAVFFSKCAMVTFGGAYAVLAYISQAAVETYRWMTAPEMLDGLGLAESTPGPLILVTQFVGFLAAHRSPSDLSPAAMGVLGTLVTLWATFAPCFLWIFAGAPYIERMRGQRALNAALSAITASVVGVVLNLSVFLGLKTLFHHTEERRALGMTLLVPDPATIDLFALGLAIAAFAGMRKWKWGVIRVVLGGAALGLLWKLVGPAA